MQDDNRFFRWLGRINSMLFFLAVLGVILSVGAMYLQTESFGNDMPRAKAVAQKGDDTYVLGGDIAGPLSGPDIANVELLDGTNEGVMKLRREGRSTRLVFALQIRQRREPAGWST